MKRKITSKIVSLVYFPAIILYFIFSSVGMAADWYVDSSASGSNNGTSWTDAWESFADIVWGSLGGTDILYISGGAAGKTYSENLEVKQYQGSSEGDRIHIKPGAVHPTLSAGHNGKVTISNTSGRNLSFGNTGNSAWWASYVTVNGNDGSNNKWIRVTGGAADGVEVRQSNNGHITLSYLEIDNNGDGSNEHGVELLNNKTGFIIDNCYIHDNYHDGINQGVGPSSSYGLIVISNCIIEDNRDDAIQTDGGTDVYNCTIDGTNSVVALHADGIQGVKGYWRIYNNTFLNFDQQIFIETTATTLQYVLIYNNVFHDTVIDSVDPKHIVLKAKTPAGAHTWDDIVIANNTFVDGESMALRLQAVTGVTVNIGTDGLLIHNNIFYNNGSNSDEDGTFSYDDTQYKVENNIFYSPTTFYYAGSSRANAAALNAVDGASSNLDSQPIFTDYAGDNFSLDSTDTIAKENGKDLSAYFVTDINGVSRPQGSAWDIGAYEFESRPAPPSNLRIKSIQ